VAHKTQSGPSGIANDIVILSRSLRHATPLSSPGLEERVRITPDGVGIGTATPATKLQVEGASDQASTITVRRSDSNKFMRLGVGAFGVALDFDPNSFFVIQKNTLGIGGTLSGEELLRVTSDGRVGVGTNNPRSALHVVGDVTVTGDLLLTGADCAEHFDI